MALTDAQHPRTPRYARAHRIAAMLAVSQATVWRWSASGRIPQPRRIGPRVTAWDVDAVLAALDRQPQAD